VIPVIDQNYDENDAMTANIYLVVPVIDLNYDKNDVVTANLAKSQEFYRNSGRSPELRYKTLIYIVILVIDQIYNVNFAVTANIHVVIPVIDRNYDINDIAKANLTKSEELSGNLVIHWFDKNDIKKTKSSKLTENYVMIRVIHRNYNE
jgi:hypothetical protein